VHKIQLTTGDRVGAVVGEPVGGIVPLLDLLLLPDFAAYNVDAYDILDSSPAKWRVRLPGLLSK